MFQDWLGDDEALRPRGRVWCFLKGINCVGTELGSSAPSINYFRGGRRSIRAHLSPRSIARHANTSPSIYLLCHRSPESKTLKDTHKKKSLKIQPPLPWKQGQTVHIAPFTARDFPDWSEEDTRKRERLGGINSQMGHEEGYRDTLSAITTK